MAKPSISSFSSWFQAVRYVCTMVPFCHQVITHALSTVEHINIKRYTYDNDFDRCLSSIFFLASFFEEDSLRFPSLLLKIIIG